MCVCVCVCVCVVTCILYKSKFFQFNQVYLRCNSQEIVRKLTLQTA